jgi:hypothetical protein
MRSARVTILMKPEQKKDLEAKAKGLGISSGEYIRLAVDNFDKPTAEEETELAVLVEEMNKAIPRMKTSLNKTSSTLRKLLRENDAFFRDRGIR